MQPMVVGAHHAAALLLRKDTLAHARLAHPAEVEPELKVNHARKQVGHEEVEQAPQLAQIVLQWRPCVTKRRIPAVLTLQNNIRLHVQMMQYQCKEPTKQKGFTLTNSP